MENSYAEWRESLQPPTIGFDLDFVQNYIPTIQRLIRKKLRSRNQNFDKEDRVIWVPENALVKKVCITDDIALENGRLSTEVTNSTPTTFDCFYFCIF